MTGWEMAADHHELVIYRPMSDGNARQSGHAYGTRHTRHDGDRDPGLGASQHFFVAAGEHERVAAFEAHHEAAGAGALDHHLVDRVLGHGPPVVDLGGVDDFDVRGQFGQQFRWREAVGDHDVGLRQQAPAAHGDEFGVAGATADQRDAALNDVGAHRALGRDEA